VIEVDNIEQNLFILDRVINFHFPPSCDVVINGRPTLINFQVLWPEFFNQVLAALVIATQPREGVNNRPVIGG
jgi:hypothetical protein